MLAYGTNKRIPKLVTVRFNAFSKHALKTADFSRLSDSQWSRIAPLLPVNGQGARRVEDQCVLSRIVHAEF